MTKAQRTRQLNRRKELTAMIAFAGIFTGVLTLCDSIGAKETEVIIDNREEQTVQVIDENIEDIKITPVSSVLEPANEIYFAGCEDYDEADNFTYCNQDLEELAHLLYAEAGNQEDIALYYVGSVVLNRVKSDRFPNTVHDVIYQPHQYSPTWNGFMERKIQDRCYTIAKDLLDNGSVIPDGVLGQACKTIYKKYGSKLYAQIGNNYFFYIK